MEKELENLIRKVMGKDIEIEMIRKKIEGIDITEQVVLDILKQLTTPISNV